MRKGAIAAALVALGAAVAIGPWFVPHAIPVASAAEHRVQVQDAWPGVTFRIPIAVAAPPDGSNRIFVVERGGRILVAKKFRGGQTVSAPTAFLDISALQMKGEELTNGHGGLLNLAFPPNFAQSGQCFVFYGTGSGTEPDPHRAVVASYRVSAQNPDVADPSSGRVLLAQRKRHGKIHFGGGFAFGPDGMLYVGLGDSGVPSDPDRAGQDLRLLEAKILRIEATSPSQPYGIPKDNPFVGRANVRPEIWAYGVRNPWRFSFDRNTGALWMGDLGQKKREEISVVPRAGNMGWPHFEADLPLVPGPAPADCVRPVFAYGRDPDPAAGAAAVFGKSVIGGVVYRGQRIPSLVGKYVFGDNGSPQMRDPNKAGRVWALPVGNGRATGSPVPVADVEDIVSIDEDAQGELYFSCNAEGRVLTLVPAP